MKRHRVEFQSYRYKTVGDLVLNWNTVAKNMQATTFAAVLEKVDKRLFSQYADGVNVFLLTDRQYRKFLFVMQK